MKLGKEGWLIQVLGEALASHQPDLAHALLDDSLRALPSRARGRAFVRRRLRASGLLFGTPEKGAAQQGAQSNEETLFRAVVLAFARLALDVATVLGAPSGRRAEQLLVLFATLAPDPDDVESLLHQLQRPGAGLVSQKLWSRVESALEQRSLSV